MPWRPPYLPWPPPQPEGGGVFTTPAAPLLGEAGVEHPPSDRHSLPASSAFRSPSGHRRLRPRWSGRRPSPRRNFRRECPSPGTRWIAFEFARAFSMVVFGLVCLFSCRCLPPLSPANERPALSAKHWAYWLWTLAELTRHGPFIGMGRLSVISRKLPSGNCQSTRQFTKKQSPSFANEGPL